LIFYRSTCGVKSINKVKTITILIIGPTRAIARRLVELTITISGDSWHIDVCIFTIPSKGSVSNYFMILNNIVIRFITNVYTAVKI